jgi:hypothetical protein
MGRDGPEWTVRFSFLRVLPILLNWPPFDEKEEGEGELGKGVRRRNPHERRKGEGRRASGGRALLLEEEEEGVGVR